MKIEQKKGTSLLMVIVVTTILLLLSIMVIFVTNGTIGITNSIDKDKEYFWEAESGLNIGLKTLKTNPGFFDNNSSYGLDEKWYSINGSSVKVLLEEVGSPGDYSWQITSSVFKRDSKGLDLVKKLRLRNLKPLLANHFTMFMTGGMGKRDLTAFRSSDGFYGPVHFNGLIKVIGSPKFNGPVSSSSDEASRTVHKNTILGTSGGFDWDDYIVNTNGKKNIFEDENFDFGKLFGSGIWDGYTLKDSDCKINSVEEMESKYIDNPIFKAGYKYDEPEKDIPVRFDSFSDVLGNGTTWNLANHMKIIVDGSESVAPGHKLDIRLTFLAGDKIKVESRNISGLSGNWKIIADGAPLSGSSAIAIPKHFFTGNYSRVKLNNIHIKGEYKNSMTVVTEEANIVIDGDLYPEELKSDINQNDFSKLQEKVKDVSSSFALIAGLGKLEAGQNLRKDRGNILIGQETTNGDGNILITAGLYAANKFGVGGGDLNISADGYLKTGFGPNYFNKLVDVRLLGNVMMKSITHFTETDPLFGVRVGMGGKFIFDPRANQGVLPNHIYSVANNNSNADQEISFSNSVIWEIL